MKKFNISDLVMKFSHYITTDKIVFMKTTYNGMTLLGQIEYEINKILDQEGEK